MLTIILLIANSFISYIAYQALENNDNPDRFLFRPYALSRGKNFPGVLLSHFSHSGFMHFLFNMITLYSFGTVIESITGTFSLFLIYIAAGITSTLLPYFKYKDQVYYQALGASGCISGVLFAAIMIYPSIKVQMMFIPIPIPGPLFAVFYLLISYYFMQEEGGRISHEAHIGGAIAGVLLGGLFSPFGYTGFFLNLFK